MYLYLSACDRLVWRRIPNFGKTGWRPDSARPWVRSVVSGSAADCPPVLGPGCPLVFGSHAAADRLGETNREFLGALLERPGADISRITVSPLYVEEAGGSCSYIKDPSGVVSLRTSVAGVEHIGIGGDFNGVEEFPDGLQDVSQYPNVRRDLIVNCVDQCELAVV